MNAPDKSPTHNHPEYSVSEISGALKRVIEGNFGYVRVRGELSGFKRAASGHLYMDLKDDSALINGVCWKGNAAKLSFKPEDGLEVIATGKITTYPSRSNYQLSIETMEPAGAGALMALLEKRKAQLAAEGLFAPERKKPLPFMPQHIGIVTSPTGAVIRDILHRLADRFPVRVTVWPVRVQGEGAAEEIANAINGFNTLSSPHPNPLTRKFDMGVSNFRAQSPEGEGTRPNLSHWERSISDSESGEGKLLEITKPDLIIVARGGGSIEDLWCFNEEIVVRAAAASGIPLISAVGHETDTTLIDYASDKRAPTPTAAAELAVPVRSEWLLALGEWQQRMNSAAYQRLSRQQDVVQHLARAIPSPQQILAHMTQRLDDWSERLMRALPQRAEQSEKKLLQLQERLSLRLVLQRIEASHKPLQYATERAARSMMARIERAQAQLTLPAGLLESLNYQQVLRRGFALVKDAAGSVISSADAARAQPSLTLMLHDGELAVKPSSSAAPKAKARSSQQPSLFEG